MHKLNKLKSEQWSLAIKLTVSMTTMTVLVVMSITLLSTQREQQASHAELEQQANLLLNTLSVATVDSLYNLDTEFLDSMMKALGVGQQIVVSGRIYDNEGRVIADAYTQEIVYNFKIDPFGQQLVNSDTTVFKWQTDELIAGKAVKIGTQRVGAISVGLSTIPLQTKITVMRNEGVGMALVTAAMGGVLTLLLSRSITRPLKRLVKATQRIANGDLSQQIVVDSSDELAVLGNAMEQMRVELQQLYLDLEQQVVKRTQALQESEKRFRQVISSISAHVYMTELGQGEGVNRYISPTVEPLTGYSLVNFTNDWRFWQSLIYPADLPIAASQVEFFAKGQDSEVEYRLIRADKEIIWVRDSGRVEKDAVSKNIVIYGVVSDITERKKAEEERIRFNNQLRTAADVTRQINAILDPEELLYEIVTLLQSRFDLYHIHIYFLNESANELVIQAGSGHRGKLLRELGHKIPFNYEHSVVARAARTQKIILVPDITTEPYFMPNPLLPDTRTEMAVPIMAGGHVLGVFDVQDNQANRFSQADIDTFSTLSGQIAIALENARLFAERKQAEEKLIVARDQALESSRLKSELLANVSHELRTPLNAALGYAEMLHEGLYGPLTDDLNEAITKIIDNSKYLLGIVNQLLDQAKLDSGKLKPKISSFASNDLINSVKSKMNALAKAKDLALTTEISADVPVMLQGDPARLQQVLVNLVGNAIKFTEKGTVKIIFYLPDSTHWAMQVSDTGVGIPLEAQSFVFEPFRQVDGSVTREYGGTGLGLSIVKRLTHLMEGEIILQSELGQGSIFTVLLPLMPMYEE